MVTKWFFLLNKKALYLKERFANFFEENAFLLEPKRLFYVIALSLVGPVLVLIYALFLFHEESGLNEKCVVLEKKVKSLTSLKKQQDSFAEEFGSSDPAFLQNYVETVSLLKEDSELLNKMAKQSTYEPIQRRLDFLSGDENQMRFISEVSRTSNYYIETEWRLLHPIEVNQKDINQILSLIEGVKMYHFVPNLLRPQLVIKKFSLKTNNGDNPQSITLDLNILQRNTYAKN